MLRGGAGHAAMLSCLDIGEIASAMQRVHLCKSSFFLLAEGSQNCRVVLSEVTGTNESMSRADLARLVHDELDVEHSIPYHERAIDELYSIG